MSADALARAQVYTTAAGRQLCGDSRELLGALPASSVDLVLTSPPFPLIHPKEYGNVTADEYLDWVMPFGREIHRVLKDTGSLVLDLGGVYEKGQPTRSLYQFQVLIAFCEALGFHLAQECYWFNRTKLASPVEWVARRKIRVKDSVNTLWWLSKTPYPKADSTRVLTPYTAATQRMLAASGKQRQMRWHPSGHRVGPGMQRDRGGAIPSNLLQLTSAVSNSAFLRDCRRLGRDLHPARFPDDLPRYFISFLTDPGDLVLDIFSGSNTTGFVAEHLGRRWLGMEQDREYAITSAVRFLHECPDEAVQALLGQMEQGIVRDLSHLTAAGN